ncbi:hypothetical protein [Streptomyces sp. A1547]|uniref:hypothetical protein n=1 Tax=Streptomyces sp. A1547 TaxID=2563105 RepID=UPI000620018F|nr:hypothetical protein [Streptomyces sp. A1547]KJY24377.1 hypothetical protein VR46_42490 [Streptomyces sp. NRRL S-444]THA29024.1 hypothetical protein E6W17_40045 [Streptomyces sp. A1547]
MAGRTGCCRGRRLRPDPVSAHSRARGCTTVHPSSPGAGGGTRRFRLEDPHLLLANEAEDEDRLSGWSTDEDADALAALSAGTFGLPVKHLSAPGTAPLAVHGEARVIDRFRSGRHSLYS